ncbi:MAG: hypothetical protein QW299_07230 [Candidatus Caldarchaeum sp.]
MAELWINQIRHIQDGEPVQASVASRPDRALENRTDYLKFRIEAATAGQALFLFDAPLEPDALIGQAVTWDATNHRFVRAQAVHGVFDPYATNSDIDKNTVWGVVYRKESSTSGVLLLSGFANLDLSQATTEPVTAGVYFLSATNPGFLTKQSPPVSIPVLLSDGDGNVLVVSSLGRNFLRDHIHFRIPLICRTAGTDTVVTSGGYTHHVIASPNSNLPGWLPANHSIFSGLAPTGAKFGYNLAKHPDLLRLWPPQPVSAAALLWYRGDRRSGFVEVPLGRDGGLALIDDNGIWWLSDCVGEVPWTSEEGSSSLASDSPDDNCSRLNRVRVDLVFHRAIFSSENAYVKSLQPRQGSPIRFYNAQGQTASTGDLFADFQPEYSVTDNDADGNIVVKEIQGSTLRRGYVVQGVRSTSPYLSITSNRTKTIGGQTYHQGLLSLSLSIGASPLSISAQLLRLDDVRERYYQDLLYFGFPKGITSSVRIRFPVPQFGLPDNPRFRLALQILGRSPGTIPNLTVTYRIVPQGSNSPQNLPLTDSPLTISTSQTLTAADTYYRVTSQQISIQPGDAVYVTISRTASDAYVGEIGLLEASGIIEPGS